MDRTNLVGYSSRTRGLARTSSVARRAIPCDGSNSLGSAIRKSRLALTPAKIGDYPKKIAERDRE
jgi:hypothetical protein